MRILEAAVQEGAEEVRRQLQQVRREPQPAHRVRGRRRQLIPAPARLPELQGEARERTEVVPILHATARTLQLQTRRPRPRHRSAHNREGVPDEEVQAKGVLRRLLCGEMLLAEAKQRRHATHRGLPLQARRLHEPRADAGETGQSSRRQGNEARTPLRRHRAHVQSGEGDDPARRNVLRRGFEPAVGGEDQSVGLPARPGPDLERQPSGDTHRVQPVVHGEARPTHQRAPRRGSVPLRMCQDSSRGL